MRIRPKVQPSRRISAISGRRTRGGGAQFLEECGTEEACGPQTASSDLLEPEESARALETSAAVGRCLSGPACPDRN